MEIKDKINNDIDFLIDNESMIYSFSRFKSHLDDVTIQRYKAIIIAFIVFLHLSVLFEVKIEIIGLAFFDITAIIFNVIQKKKETRFYIVTNGVDISIKDKFKNNQSEYIDMLINFSIFAFGENDLSAYETIDHIKNIRKEKMIDNNNFEKIKKWFLEYHKEKKETL